MLLHPYDVAPMTEPRAEKQSVRALPRTIGLAKMIAHEGIVEGQVAASELSRLTGVLANEEGYAAVKLSFAKDEQNRRCISGELSALINVFCQRCLSAMPLQLEQTLSLAAVGDEEAGKQLPASLDPVLVEEDELSLYELIEDELLLALPIVSMHAEKCGERHRGVRLSEQAEPRQKPFEDLASMLGKQ